jgi:hypothetical protein
VDVASAAGTPPPPCARESQSGSGRLLGRPPLVGCTGCEYM